MKAKEFLELIIDDLGNINPEEGFRFKYFEDEIRGIVISWMVSKKVLDFMVKNKFNLLISHEDLYFPPDYAYGYSKNKGILSNLRKKILEEYRINFIRLHSTIDKHFIFDVFDEICGGKVLIKEGFYRIYNFENKTLENLIEELKRKFKVKFLRVLKKKEKVKRAGCLVGGMGLSINASFIDKVCSYKIDTVIAGEVDEYTIRALYDLNINIVEIGHEASETPGLIKFKKYLKDKFPDIPIKYIKNSYPVRIFY